nr:MULTISPECIES: hypothetical protein [unclassified Providencia]
MGNAYERYPYYFFWGIAMSGVKFGDERFRSATGNNKRLSRFEINEINHAIEIENSKSKRKGKKPKLPQVVRFHCGCNCFVVKVDWTAPSYCRVLKVINV